MRVRWTTDAADDLERICDYIAESRPESARMVAKTIVDGVGILELFPHRGRAGRVEASHAKDASSMTARQPRSPMVAARSAGAVSICIYLHIMAEASMAIPPFDPFCNPTRSLAARALETGVQSGILSSISSPGSDPDSRGHVNKSVCDTSRPGKRTALEPWHVDLLAADPVGA